MSQKNIAIKPLAAAVGVALLSSLAFSSLAVAADNPFAATDLESGYLLAGEGDTAGDKGEEGKCGEGKCGENKGEEGKCGEGKCGENKGEEGKCGEGKAEEGKCGEGKCGADKGAEGSCGGDKAADPGTDAEKPAEGANG
jgi:uncharacterized low-complexity protein